MGAVRKKTVSVKANRGWNELRYKNSQNQFPPSPFPSISGDHPKLDFGGESVIDLVPTLALHIEIS